MLTNRVFHYLISVLLLTILFTSCKKDPVAPLSIKTVAKQAGFQVTSSAQAISKNGTNIAFDRDSMRFSAGFNHEVTWTITITGLSHPTEHAIKKISGTSDTINPTKNFWIGDSDNIYFFKKNENVQVTLTFFGDQETTIDMGQFRIVRTRIFDGVLVLNFEADDSKNAIITLIGDIYDFTDGEAGKEEIQIEKFKIPDNNLPQAVEGQSYLRLYGQDVLGKPSPFYMGGVNHDSIPFGLTGSTDDIFMNFYVNSNGNRTSKIEAKIYGEGGDEFSKTFEVTWTGWKQLSVRLSDFKLSNAADGPGELTPSKIAQTAFLIHSGNGQPGNKAELLIDHVTFTTGGPFSQSK